MDLYSFINSPDVADYCRGINKVWTTFEMAVIIGRSERPMAERHMAWRELIADYPDMPVPRCSQYQGHESLHQILSQEITYEERILELFKTPEQGAVYQYTVEWKGRSEPSDSVYTSYEKAWVEMTEDWENEKSETETIVRKIYTDDKSGMEVRFGCDWEIHHCRAYGGKKRMEEWFPGIQSDNEALTLMDQSPFYVDIPLPFKPGDILTSRCNGQYGLFVLEPCSEEVENRRFRSISEGSADWTDMTRWGFFVSEEGVLYEDHTPACDSFMYYRGTFTGNDRLLYYVSLYLKGEIHLPDLMVMQVRIMLEYQLCSNLDMKSHICCILKHLLEENRLSKEGKIPGHDEEIPGMKSPVADSD